MNVSTNSAPAPAPAPPPVPIPFAGMNGLQATDMLWSVFLHNVNSGAWNSIEVPLALKSVIGNEGIEVFTTRFRQLIQAPVVVVEDSNQGVVKIKPARHPLGHNVIIPQASKGKPRTSKKVKVARPPNAFILYRQHHHPLLKSQHPELHNNQISVILGTQWKMEDEGNKAQYVTLAKQLKAKHLLENPGYQYQPRKPSEKKRRMTRRKAESLANANAVSSDITPVLATPAVAQDIPNMDLPTSSSGNVVLELGDDTYDDEPFSTALERYNNSFPVANNQAAAVVAQEATPVLYNENVEDAQNDINFYSTAHELDNFTFNQELEDEMDAILNGGIDLDEAWANMSRAEQEAEFDKETQSLSDAELARMSSLWDEFECQAEMEAKAAQES